jgi:predicted transcriptional regulator
MSELLEKAIEAVRLLAPEVQDDRARIMLHLTGNEDEPEPIEPHDLSAIPEGLAQAECGEFTRDAEVEAVFRRFG